MRRLLRVMTLVVIAGALMIGTACVALWAEHRTSVDLPAPRGPNPVGRSMHVWRDDRRPDALEGSPGTRTELIVWTWYPAAVAAAPPSEYLPAEWRRAVATQQGWLLSTFLIKDPSSVHPHSTTAPPLAAAELAYPVVVLRAGLGALTIAYTALAEELASHGYVVVGFDVPYRTGVVVLPEGRVAVRPPHLNPETLPTSQQPALLDRLLHAWVRDMTFAVDRLGASSPGSAEPFSSRLDLTRLAVVGHSLGGAAAAQFCHDDSRCRVGVNLDGALRGSVIQEGLRQPFMFVTSDHGDTLSERDRDIVADIRGVYERLPSDTRVALKIRGADHFSASDQLLMRSRLFRLFLQLEPRRGIEVISDVARRFLDRHLKNGGTQDAGDAAGRYPEVEPLFAK